MRCYRKWGVGLVDSALFTLQNGGSKLKMRKLSLCAPAASAAENRRSRTARSLWLGFSTAVVVMLLVSFCGPAAWAQSSSGSISGTVKDASGGVVPNAPVSVTNTATKVEQTTQANGEGFYAFPSLAVGQYEVNVSPAGFRPYKRKGLTVDVNTKLQVDAELVVGEQSEQVTVSDTADVQVETESTQMGELVPGQVMVAVGLNGRSYTDLLSLQPGIVPMSTQTKTSVVMAGVIMAITPSGDLNPGNQSINGQREDANGFLVNGSDVKELMNGGTTIIPDLDSISEFRVLTNNFDPEYGNYAGGIVNAVTKSGTDQFHGSAFEFLRNTALDAKSFFAPFTDAYDQNQFGGTIGGPIKKGKLFLLRRLPGNKDNPRPGYRAGNRALSRRTGRRLQRHRPLRDSAGGGVSAATFQFAGPDRQLGRQLFQCVSGRHDSAERMDRSIAELVEIRPDAQCRPHHVYWLCDGDAARRQMELSRGREQHALGEYLGVLLF